MKISVILGFATLLVSLLAHADDPKTLSARWTGKEDKNAQFDHIVAVVNTKTGLTLSTSDFMLVEDRDLANNHFAMYSQVVAGLPVKGSSIRVWTTIAKNPEVVQVEAYLQGKKEFDQKVTELNTKRVEESGKRTNLYGVAKSYLRNKEDNSVRGLKVSDVWINHEPSRMYEIKGKHGKHLITISLLTKKVIDYKYSEFPQMDIPAKVYPIYEEVESNGHLQKRVDVTLKYLDTDSIRAVSDPYAVMRTHRYFEDKFDPILGSTEEGRNQGYWNMDYLKAYASQIRSRIRTTPNIFSDGVILEGRFATVSLHPDVIKKFSGLTFTPMISAQFKPDWVESTPPGASDPMMEMVPSGALLGRPLTSFDEALNRPARRLPDHNPVQYMNDGFDEVQVYYAVTTLMESLRKMGFTDPDLSTRPFNAFMYDPDIAMKDNAFYTDDTINFTTYSPQGANLARDNSTIWHELGHGIMDRLMGDSIQLADTGGLSEGMADFVAALVIADVTNNQPFEGSDEFRIINNTGFNLTNEAHDDGEAYGGSMKDLLDLAITKYGQDGVSKVTDLTLEAMRLSRNHPALTANDWFSHMLFADELGHSGVRVPGELSPLIIQALNGRNFSLDGGEMASFKLFNGKDEVVAGKTGSRDKPVMLTLAPGEKSTYHLRLSLKETSHYKFDYPVEVKLMFNGGPLEGAIKWESEEKGPITRVINSDGDEASVDVTATGACDFVNQEDGTCKDYIYAEVFKTGVTKPVAKKRFYVRLTVKK